jgi:RimJ/RimL family protein N-acetyltransferase
MQHPYLIGEKVYLRALTEEDLEGPWFDWVNDYEVTRLMGSATGRVPNTAESMKRYFQNVIQSPDNVMLAIMEKSSDTHIGNIKIGPIDRLHLFADMAILIGDKGSWGKGYGQEAWELMIAYGFERLNLHKITLGVLAKHEVAVRLYERLGFKMEGTLRKQMFWEGGYEDNHLMGMLREEYLERTRGKGQDSATHEER